jgi:hypothetical protein
MNRLARLVHRRSLFPRLAGLVLIVMPRVLQAAGLVGCACIVGGFRPEETSAPGHGGGHEKPFAASGASGPVGWSAAAGVHGP